MSLDTQMLIKDLFELLLEANDISIRYENLHVIIDNNIVTVEEYECEKL
jgi:hypothetical protein